ncbi:tRNA (5-methylaminomethyl-2-thiouridine)(34)-methyltransferase MnmD [Yoonia sp.]|uniref:tRNA (5-methylaminomethyl-2-thiouridine)(34)-methyltransferase MnmD n=1 Tax=Yoonia sp. TaxID=2212373 RepID=UPI002FD9848D
MTGQSAEIDWKGGVPIARLFDDPYYSLDNGLDETRHVFLAGNDLPARFGGDFRIAELGFGTGLNFLVTWAAWETAGKPGALTFTSFEAFPMPHDAMAEAVAHFPQIAPFAKIMLANWQAGDGPTALGEGLTLDVILGDARVTVPEWQGRADAWYLDGFSPAKNPQLWEPSLIRAVGHRTKPQGTAATYSAAGHVRRALEDAGFTVTRAPGFGRKRHMTTARMTHAD